MTIPGTDSRPVPLAASDEGLATAGPRLPAAVLRRLRTPGPGLCAEAPGSNPRALTLSGDIDVTTAETVRDSAARCLRDQPDVLIVDLREANFCDSMGVRVLRWILRRTTLVGARVRVIPPGEDFCRMLRLLDADDLLAIISSAR
jgi:anti-anti-sigma factor